MSQIPRAPLILGLLGTIPFIWGAFSTFRPDIGGLVAGGFGSRFVGPYISLSYGTVILAFMSGVLWGFATQARGRQAALGYTLSVIPALWAFFMAGGGPVSAAMNLIFGFLGVLILDWQFWRWNLTPDWWMALRVLLTAIVVLSLLPITL